MDDLPVLGKDILFNEIDSAACRVIKFNPHGRIENNQVSVVPNFPYASLIIECSKVQPNLILNITHKTDFINLWKAFQQKEKEQEVLIFWTNKHYGNFIYKILSSFMPKLWVMICKKGAYELTTDKDYKPELTGEARYLAKKSIVDWKPEVME